MEHEICNNCKKEIPQTNYVMHTMHCSRNITLCKVCNEPIPKLEYESHREKCRKPLPKKPAAPPASIEKSFYFEKQKEIEDKKAAVRKENYLKRHDHLVDTGFTLRESVNGYGNSGALSNTRSAQILKQQSSPAVSSGGTNSQSNGGAIKKESKPPLIPRRNDDSTSGPRPKGPQGLLPCRYCDLELPKLDLEEHENYCGSRTDKCLECGELVMFKNKQVHLDSNHGFVKLKDEPGPQPSWESTTQRSASASNIETSQSRRRFRFTDFDFDPTPYLPAAYQPGGGLKKKEGESYKEISRRLDCKTEYIRNLLHDSASITIPLRSSGTAPRNHFNHNKGPAPQPPASRRRNPPTELVIPCEFCDTPIPHEDLIQHQSGCRPDLARYNPRRNRSAVAIADEDDYFVAPPPRSDSPDDEELPCEFCANMVPASQLWRHQLTCTAPA
ncbi:TRAF-type zinc finger domain-containing protein 1-like isoform X2 [Sitophilus oryzae]|uniref:TRAF-type zinc finger domain-containing protein 1-like isoform X2 n=1 Tax=Sitophilus oryzae TaxID=7048 RepID=A0A6J2Y004_SITOR|nr:TRAF-type zinc finger domain-containing protein 1-like isoform X2 [Sitophilus oryzae]